jgi:GH24 family phage-related lysozyme (muramidase)
MLNNNNRWGFIDDLVMLTEGEPNVFEWDILKEKIDTSKKDVKTKDQAEEYLNTFLDKIKKVPKVVKVKMVKYVITGLVGLMGMNTITNIISSGSPEIKTEVLMTKSSPELTQQHPNEVSDNLLKFLKYEEGSIKQKGEPVLTAYTLGDKMVTIGWGHAERLSKSKYKKGESINRQKAEELFKRDVSVAKGGLDRLLSRWGKSGIKYDINQGRYDAMVSMIFNMGTTNFLKSDFIQIVKKGEYEKAEEHIKHTHITYPGHTPRRKKESEMFGGKITETMSIKNIVKEESSNFDWTNKIEAGYRGCSHFTDRDTNHLCMKISKLRSWLHRDLGLRVIIDGMLKDLKVVEDMTEKYQTPLKILHDTGKYPEIKLVGGTYTHYRLLNAGLVLGEDGEYDYVNKLNTNYSDLAELVTELMVKGGKVSALVNKNELGIKSYLESIKPVLYRLITKYFQPEDLKQFVRNTHGLTIMGDDAEDYAGEVLKRYGMKQLYQGGNGDFIDMLFGADLIMDSNGRVITCQVKSSEYQAVNASKSSQYKKIDYFISPNGRIGNGIVIYNRGGESFKMGDGGNVL